MGDGVDQVGLALFYRGAAAVDALAAVATRRCRRWDRFFSPDDLVNILLQLITWKAASSVKVSWANRRRRLLREGRLLCWPTIGFGPR